MDGQNLCALPCHWLCPTEDPDWWAGRRSLGGPRALRGLPWTRCFLSPLGSHPTAHRGNRSPQTCLLLPGSQQACPGSPEPRSDWDLCNFHFRLLASREGNPTQQGFPYRVPDQPGRRQRAAARGWGGRCWGREPESHRTQSQARPRVRALLYAPPSGPERGDGHSLAAVREPRGSATSPPSAPILQMEN